MNNGALVRLVDVHKVYRTGEMEVQAFKGGFGIDFYQKAAEDYQKLNSDLKVTVAGNPRVYGQLVGMLGKFDMLGK